MSTRIPLEALDQATRSFLEQQNALGGFLSVQRGEGPTELALSNGTHVVEPLPPGVHSALLLAAARTDGVMSTVYEFVPGAPSGAGTGQPPRRSQFPDTQEGGRAYARALGEHHAANRDAFERQGLPPDGRPTMSRAAFEALDPLAKRQAVRDRVRLFD